MIYLYYIAIYLGIGALFMLILDIMHKMVQDVIDDEFKEGYKNWERVYIIITWPAFIFSMFKSAIESKQNQE
jgi:hypothetical protein